MKKFMALKGKKLPKLSPFVYWVLGVDSCSLQIHMLKFQSLVPRM